MKSCLLVLALLFSVSSVRAEGFDPVFTVEAPTPTPEPLKHVIALQLGVSAPLGGQAGVTYTPPIGLAGRSPLFELQANMGSLYYMTSYEVGVRVSIPYAEFLYANIGYQWLGSSVQGEDLVAAEINSKLAEEFEGQENTSDIRLKSGDIHFRMRGLSLGAGFKIGIFRIEGGVTKYNLYETIDLVSAQVEAKGLEIARSHLSGEELADAEREIRESREEFNAEVKKSLREASEQMRLPQETVPYFKIAVAIPLFRL